MRRKIIQMVKSMLLIIITLWIEKWSMRSGLFVFKLKIKEHTTSERNEVKRMRAWFFSLSILHNQNHTFHSSLYNLICRKSFYWSLSGYIIISWVSFFILHLDQFLGLYFVLLLHFIFLGITILPFGHFIVGFYYFSNLGILLWVFCLHSFI